MKLLEKTIDHLTLNLSIIVAVIPLQAGNL